LKPLVADFDIDVVGVPTGCYAIHILFAVLLPHDSNPDDDAWPPMFELRRSGRPMHVEHLPPSKHMRWLVVLHATSIEQLFA
jgi:hypothetical protein